MVQGHPRVLGSTEKHIREHQEHGSAKQSGSARKHHVESCSVDHCARKSGHDVKCTRQNTRNVGDQMNLPSFINNGKY